MEKIIKNLKYIIPGILILIILIFFSIKKEENEESEPEQIIENIEKIDKEIQPEEIRIDIKGEIKNPGVYKLSKGDRVYDAIKVSGGLTENADTTLINLSKNLTDEMVIIIYNKNEIEKIKQENLKEETIIKYIEKECSCPDTINDACIKETSKETQKSEPTKDNKISLNNATLEELLTLPGIGESKAKQIIKYREENKGFKSIEEITNISGIGESTFEKFKDYITI